MSKKQTDKLQGPWKSVQTAIWLIGLAILALNDWWWPGILILVAVSMLSQAVIQFFVPGAVERVGEDQVTQNSSVPPQPVMPNLEPSPTEYPTNRLPSECPKCGAPIRGVEVRWISPQSADCPYCGANLPLRSK